MTDYIPEKTDRLDRRGEEPEGTDLSPKERYSLQKTCSIIYLSAQINVGKTLGKIKLKWKSKHHYTKIMKDEIVKSYKG